MFCPVVKTQFVLIITAGRGNAVNIVDTTGLDVALGINDIPDKLEFLVKGRRSPGNPQTDAQEGYFDLSRNSLLDNTNYCASGRVYYLSLVTDMNS